MKYAQQPMTQFEKDNSDLLSGIIRSVEEGEPIDAVIQRLESEQIDERVLNKAVHFVIIRLTDAHTNIVERIKQLRIEKYSDEAIGEILTKSENIKQSLIDLICQGIILNEFYTDVYGKPLNRRFTLSSTHFGILLILSAVLIIVVEYALGYVSTTPIYFFAFGVFGIIVGKYE